MGAHKTHKISSDKSSSEEQQERRKVMGKEAREGMAFRGYTHSLQSCRPLVSIGTSAAPGSTAVTRGDIRVVLRFVFGHGDLKRDDDKTGCRNRAFDGANQSARWEVAGRSGAILLLDVEVANIALDLGC